jgi:hypothetical protein
MAILNLLIAGEKDQQEGGQSLLACSPPLTSGSFLSLASSQGKGCFKKRRLFSFIFLPTQGKCRPRTNTKFKGKKSNIDVSVDANYVVNNLPIVNRTLA